jgi:hypothetical protein
MAGFYIAQKKYLLLRVSKSSVKDFHTTYKKVDVARL